MPIRISDLIARIPETVEREVRRTRDQTRSILQEALRTECRLVMRTPEEVMENRSGAQVSVRVTPGYPLSLQNLTIPDDHELFILLGRYRSTLEHAQISAAGMLKLHEEIERLKRQDRIMKATKSELSATEIAATHLLKLLEDYDPLKKLLIEEDILGIYEYEIPNDLFTDDFTVNRASIKLYWGVIGLVADWMGCPVQDLTVVVLAHELAHAYTQLGADIEGRRWHAKVFSKADIGLKEGLAQYYTDRVLRRLERRYVNALKVYEAMLLKQPQAYKTHISWVHDFSPEAVRRAMLEVRRWQEGNIADFNQRLAKAHNELHGGFIGYGGDSAERP